MRILHRLFPFEKKKAQGQNILAPVVFLMIFGFINIFAYMIWAYFMTAFNATGLVTPEITTTMAAFTRGFQAFDYVIVLVMALFIIGTGVYNYRVAAASEGFLITILLGAFWGFISYFFNYVFIQLVSPTVFTASVGAFPKTILLCTNLHWVALALMVVEGMTLYSKKEKGQYLA